MHKWTSDFLDTVASQIRWKSARPVVLRELEDHLEDQCSAYLNSGMNLQQARMESLRQMGDPTEVGIHLNAIHRPKHSMEIVVILAVLLFINLFIWMQVFYDGSLSKWLWTPLLAMGLGLSAMSAVYFLPWNRLLNHIGLLSVIGWTGLFLVAVHLNHSRSSDYAVYLFPLLYVCILYHLRNKGVWGYLLHLLVFGVLFWLSVNLFVFLGTLFFFVTSLIEGILVIKYGAFQLRKWKLALMVLPHALLAGIYVPQFLQMNSTDRWLPQRFSMYFDQILDHANLIGPGTAFQTVLYDRTVLITPKEAMLPFMDECDFFLSTVIYRCGWLVGIGLVVFLVSFFLWCLKKGMTQPSLWSKLLSCAIVVPMLLQTLLHTTNNLFSFVASAQLPLLSYGNTYRILDLTMIGLLLSVFRNRTILRDTKPKIA